MKTSTRIRWGQVWGWAAGGFVVFVLLSHRGWLAGLAFVVFACASWLGQRARKQPQAAAPKPLSPQMAAHYQAAGLNDREVALFRQTMEDAADAIETIEAISDRVPPLAAIAANTDLIAVLHAFFKAIVQAPKQMSQANHFLYEQLPSLQRIMTKYEEISHHEVKTEDTYNVLTTAANTISDLARAIRAGYAAFVETDIEDLQAALALAQKQLPEAETLRHQLARWQPATEETRHSHE